MAFLKIYGASDDLIEIEGAIHEEFSHASWRDETPAALLAFSDGTLLEVEYDADGIWRIKRLAEGTCSFTLEPGNVEKDTNDIATLTGDNLRWCMKGERDQYNPSWARKAK